MSRSLKKGPFCDDHLMKKVEELNKAGKNKLSKPGHVVQLYSLSLWNIHLPFTTVRNTCLFTLQRTW